MLAKVKENILYLEHPEEIEDRGGYVPGGILLWGPPGTGKTLMAEAVAGETGKPYVFVDPGAFINMFFGVGVLKVKGLFRKLRKLALRYGGVIVFFDEADSLGNRGALAQGGPGLPARDDARAAAGRAATASPTCRRTSQWMLLRRGHAVGLEDEPEGGRSKQIIGGGHGRRRRWRHGHAAGAAHRAVRAEEAARLRQPARPPDASACGPSRRRSTGSW